MLGGRGENGRKRSENTKIVTVFIFFLSETVTSEMETISVFRKHRNRKFGMKNTSVPVGTLITIGNHINMKISQYNKFTMQQSLQISQRP
jgi:hypothetical protein